MKKRSLLLLIVLNMLFMMASCSNYQVTFNNQPVYSPPKLFSDFQIEDTALYNCLTQTITDQRITQAQDLRQLNCAYAGIENLSGITQFKWLQTVNLANNQIRDIKPLMFLGNVREINLEGNNLLRCNDLRALKNLVSDRVLVPSDCLN
jgi:Leucine-rich repeat (LRR) protein